MSFIRFFRDGSSGRAASGLAAKGKAIGAVLGLAALAATVGGASPMGPAFGTDSGAEQAIAARSAALQAQASELAARQRVLDEVGAGYVVGLPPTEAAGLEVAAAAGAALDQASVLLPAPAALAGLEARQLEFADALAGLIDARAAQVEQSIRRVGLNPGLMMAKLDDRSAQGGPLLTLASGAGAQDPRFARLGASVVRLSALERALDAIPSHLPASLEFISSPFGARSDPLTGEAAMHAGLDFRGPIGAPILAAASGTVTFAGDQAGYGNLIEITHGNGMTTRYAHMSAFKARVGQRVAAGDVVGAIGNTGRSTGPHLHFEVRINGQAVNPRPFLEAGAARG